MSQPLVINPIYKVNYLVDGLINTIFVFAGNDSTLLDKESLLKKSFTNDEMNIIQSNNINVIFSNQQIHMDDSVGVIKVKILIELKKDVSIEELYLFCQKTETLNSVSLYQSLTQNKRIELTQIRLDQFVSNIVSDVNGEKFNVPTPKDVYDYDDILEMKIDDKKYIINKVLGQKFFIIENEYPFICNPYDVDSYDTFFERKARKTISTLNSHLLLNTGQIINNNIYLCLAKDVLEFVSNKDVNEETTVKIYYPFLYDRNINNLKDLEKDKTKLIDENKKVINDKTDELFKTIDMFYDIFTMRKTELKYINKGIKYIKAVISPDFNVKMPLDIIFKIIHASESNPLIKYNPSQKQENIYRLYTDQIATDGRQIPSLKKSTIIQLMKDIGKTKSVAVFIEQIIGKTTQTIICEFDENGYVTISCNFINAINKDDINVLFKNSINPILQEIKNLLEQSGYKLNLFNSLDDESVEIRQLTYETQIKITKPINLDSYKGCVSSIFINETSKNQKDIDLRFKRVSNFNKVTSQEAFILEKIEDGYKGDELVNELLQNYVGDLTREQAIQLIRKVANEVQLEQGVRRTSIKIKDNPGFKTKISLDEQTGVITIIVENINDINYLSTIPVYLDSLIRLTQDITSTNYPTKEINMLCSTDEKEEINIKDIISQTESSAIEHKESVVEDYDIDYTKEGDKLEKAKDAFDLIFGDDDYEDEEEIFEGGKNTSDSEPSISSIVNSSQVIDVQPQEEEGDQEEEDQEEEGDQEEGDQEEGDQEEGDQEEEDQGDEVTKLDNKQLAKPYYFQEMIEKRDPLLILKRRTKHFNSYSRICSSDLKKQPVILDDKELARIQKEHKDFLRPEDVIKYGSDPNNKFNYICPRYWCLKTNTIINPNELTEVIDEKTGKKVLEHPTCGRILPEKSDKIIPGHYIYEFYKPKPGKKGKPESKKYPGLIPNSHPDGLCLPCCFSHFDTPGRKAENEECLGEKDVIKKIAVEDVKKKQVTRQDEYIIGPDKYPLQPGRWGYLPLSIQQMLRVVNADCQVSETNTNIKPNHPCLVRHGVEINDKQSFIACISDAVFFAKKTVDNQIAKVLTIDEFKNRILESLTIDNFIKYQNGNLVTDFHDLNAEVDIDKYKNTKLFTKLDLSKSEDLFFFRRVVSAFENFGNYLKDPDAIIDHTYLWDIVTTPNSSIFPIGINLIIFKIPDDDITNNIELICPTNHYVSDFYDSRKPTVILVEQGNYYEPIYSYTNKGNDKLVISKEFKEHDPNLSNNMRTVIKEVIKPFFNAICKPLNSMPEGGLPQPNVYEAKRPLLLYNLVQKLDRYKYQVEKLVVNFNNKVIGVVATSPSAQTGFIPCYPSALNYELKENLDYVFMTDLSIWRTYEETFTFLDQLSKRSKKKREEADIPCKPAFKVVEDHLIVGILTETNQFIQLSTPVAEIDINIDQNLPSIDNDSFIVNVKDKPMVYIDVPTTTSNEVDNERVDYIKKIKLETNFYNVFRNTVRILLNDYENIKLREKIENEMSKDYIIYTKKLENINEMLRQLVGKKVQFTGNERYYKIIDEVSTCIINDKDRCDSKICALTNDSCNLILPEKNLITNKQNEPVYFGKMADELIRYNRITSYMFQPQNYLSFGNIGYNLRDNEIIMIQSLLKEYFDLTLTPSVSNKYVKYNSYDEAEPVISQIYDNVVTEITTDTANNKNVCEPTKNEQITSKLWKDIFPENFKEISYGKTRSCTFSIIIDLIEKKSNQKMNVNQIKNVLYEEYKKYLQEYSAKILDILIIEGKKTLGDQVKAAALSFVSFIYTENYFLTPFDFWLLVQKYEIPTLFISQRELLQTNYTTKSFVGYGERGDKFACIVIPGLRPENVPGYKLIVNDKDESFISLDTALNNELILESFDTRTTIESYLTDFTKRALTENIKKQKPKLIRVDQPNNEENPLIEPLIEPATKKTITKKNTTRKKKLNIVAKAV